MVANLSSPTARPAPLPNAEAAPAQPTPLRPQTTPVPPVTDAPEHAILPTVGPAKFKRRHRGLVWGFVLSVLLPLALIAGYLWGVARDQYGSTVGFTVRKEEGVALPQLSFSALLGGNNDAGQSRVLYEYLRSSSLVADLDADLNLRAHYSAGWPQDPLYSVPADVSLEALTRFWLRLTRIAYDEISGLLSVELRAMDPDYARAMAVMLVERSEAMINALNETSRADAMRYAAEDLEAAVTRLREAQEKMIAFRLENQMVDPGSDLQGRSGILNSLQSQLAQAYVEHDLIASDSPSDPRRSQIERRITVIRDRIAIERQSLTTGDQTNPNSDYPTLLARYAGLSTNMEVAEEIYRAALAGYETTRSRAERNTLYLATYVRPTRAEISEYPSRVQILALSALFLLCIWATASLTWYSLRDRS